MSLVIYVGRIIVPSYGYAAGNGLLYKVQNTDIILVRAGPESSFFTTV